MKLEEINFDDDAFKAAVIASGAANAEEVTEIRGRRQQIRSTRGLEHFPNLKLLDLTRNRISSLDLSGNPHLQQLFVGNNALEDLDVSGLGELEGLEVFMNDLESLDLTHNPRLEVLYANANDFIEIDLSHNPLLEEVQLSDNQLKQLLLPDAINLQNFAAANNKFTDEQKAELKIRLADCATQL